MNPELQENNLLGETLFNQIRVIRGKRVILDRDLAVLYGVQTRDLNKAVKRNMTRFPDDFVFQLSEDENRNLMFQNGTSSWGGTRKPPFAYTEHGVAMLASLLNSETAISVSVQIVRLFIKLRDIFLIHKELLGKVQLMENTLISQQEELNSIFHALDALSRDGEENLNRNPIGFQLTPNVSDVPQS